MVPRVSTGKALLLSTILLMACGQSFDELDRQGMEMVDRIGLLEPTEEMPTTGTATYAGVALVDFGSDPGGFRETLSRVTLNADFEEERVGGTMTDWASSFGDRIDSNIQGSLTIFAGSITDNEMSALARGSLTGKGREARVDLVLDGDFVGDDADAVAGGIGGSVRYRHKGGSDAVSGIFGAERE